MIEHIIGEIIHIDDESLIVESSGIGYRVFSSNNSLEDFLVGDLAHVYTYLYVREDSMTLYGFSTIDELDFFKLLIGVTSIGPKNAITILSSLSPSKIAKAIQSNDINTLTQAKGVGKKTASRIILELSDKLEGFALSFIEEESESSFNVEIEAGVEALVGLGYSRNDVIKAFKILDLENMEIEEIIKEGLKRLSK